VYSDQEAAELYNVLNPWGASDDFYRDLAMRARSVLDVGCGTGTMLHRARAAGHTGRLAGVDPDVAALDIARRDSSIEWVQGRAADIVWAGEFELAVMMSHAFQFLVTDSEIRESLSAIARALVPGGGFVFETRNPADRAWEQWAAMDPFHVTDPAGRVVRLSYDVLEVDRDVVTFEEITSDEHGKRLRADRASLRFLGLDDVTNYLHEAGFVVRKSYGDWDGRAFRSDCAELIIDAELVTR
jgi:SAM-dependent methyltransferase